MKISHLFICNYRNLRNIDIPIGNSVILIGENNSGKSNFLRAITLPFLADDTGGPSKNLSWADINNDAKSAYYEYLLCHQQQIVSGEISCDEFISHMPVVTVEVRFDVEPIDTYYAKNLSISVDDGKIVYGLRYEYKPHKITELYQMVQHILTQESLDSHSLQNVKMNLLPTEYYAYSITVPGKGSVSYDTLKLYRYTSVEAERDDFSKSREHLGSKSLIKLLQAGLSGDEKVKVEKEYTNFFNKLKSMGNMDQVINWQDDSDLKDAKKFFEHITILPNMPPMQTILNSIRLGYSDAELSSQGLGYRNLVLLFVLLNSLVDKTNELALNTITIEEPEAHLCVNNIKLVSSFLRYFCNHATSVQLFYSTHSTEFINKIDLRNIVILHAGKACSLQQELTDEERDYLSKNPNMDVYKLFFSKNAFSLRVFPKKCLFDRILIPKAS